MSEHVRTRRATPPGTPIQGGRMVSRWVELDAIETVCGGLIDDRLKALGIADWSSLVGARRPTCWIVDTRAVTGWWGEDAALCAQAIRRFLDGGGRAVLFVGALPEVRARARRLRHAVRARIEFFTSRAAADARLRALR